jgi:hypothetical protein
MVNILLRYRGIWEGDCRTDTLERNPNQDSRYDFARSLIACSNAAMVVVFGHPRCHVEFHNHMKR